MDCGPFGKRDQRNLPAPRARLIDRAGDIRERERLHVISLPEINAAAIDFDAAQDARLVLRDSRQLRATSFARPPRRRQPTLQIPGAITRSHDVQTGPHKSQRAQLEVAGKQRNPAHARNNAIRSQQIFVTETRVFANGHFIGFDSRQWQPCNVVASHFHRPAERLLQLRRNPRMICG